MKAIIPMIWILNILEIIACLVSFLYYNKLRSSHWRWLSFFLFFIVCIEFAGRYFAETKQYEANTLLFRYLGFPVFFLFYFYIFFRHEYFAGKKNWIIAGCFIYLAGIIVESFLPHQNSYWFSSLSYCTANLLLVIYLLFYFLQLIRSNDILNFSRSLMFWFCLGLLIYYIGTLPFYGLRNLLITKYINIYKMYSYIWVILNYCMYTSFTIGIIRCKLK